jgi:probable phosphoglycerate mutase
VSQLRECGVGTLEGRSDSAAFTRYHAAWDRWLVGDALDYRLGPGGETGHEVLDRMRIAIDSACTAHRGGTVVLVSHGGILQFALSTLLTNVSPAWTGTLPIQNAATVVAICDVSGLHCESWCGVVPPNTSAALR